MLCWYKWVVNVLVLLLLQLYLFDFFKERINTLKLWQIIWIIFWIYIFKKKEIFIKLLFEKLKYRISGSLVFQFFFFCKYLFYEILGGLSVYLIIIFLSLNLFEVDGLSIRTMNSGSIKATEIPNCRTKLLSHTNIQTKSLAIHRLND